MDKNRLYLELRNIIWDYCNNNGVDGETKKIIVYAIKKHLIPKENASVDIPKVPPAIDSLNLYVVTGTQHMAPADDSLTCLFYVLAHTNNEAHKKTLRSEPFVSDTNWFIHSIRKLEFPGYSMVLTEVGPMDVVSYSDIHN